MDGDESARVRVRSGAIIQTSRVTGILVEILISVLILVLVLVVAVVAAAVSSCRVLSAETWNGNRRTLAARWHEPPYQTPGA